MSSNCPVAKPLLPYAEGCIEGRFLARAKRFLVHIEHEKGDFWIHSNNTGSMLGLMQKGLPVLASKSSNPARKLPFTLEAVRLGEHWPSGGFWVGVNTAVPNRMIEAAFKAGLLPFAQGYAALRREVRRGESRLDAKLEGPNLPSLWVECKNVTLVEDGVALFPDAASARGLKHLRELASIARRGERAAMFYLVQRPDASCFAPADMIDPDYAQAFAKALEAGVAMHIFQADVSPLGISLGPCLPLAPSLC